MAFKSLDQAEFGVSMFPTDYSIQPAQFARALEDRGFDSLFYPEHTHIPVSRATPFPGGGDLPEQYWHSHDPFVALSVSAAVTERIKVGTGICLIIERDPITTAKEIASLDMISNGRAIIGIGAGWNREEMENHGANFKNRWAVVKEKVQAMQAIWSNDEAEYHGEWVDFDPIWSWPKPIQVGGPPIWIGAQSKWVIDRVVDYADGWMPIGGLQRGQTEQLAEACKNAGRNVEEVDLALFGAFATADFVRSRSEHGFDHFVFNVPPADADTVLPMLDQYVAIVEEVKAG